MTNNVILSPPDCIGTIGTKDLRQKEDTMSELKKFPHHTKVGAVDWARMPSAIASFRGSYDKPPVQASPDERLETARHLAQHYRTAGKPLPVTLAVPI